MFQAALQLGLNSVPGDESPDLRAAKPPASGFLREETSGLVGEESTRLGCPYASEEVEVGHEGSEIVTERRRSFVSETKKENILEELNYLGIMSFVEEKRTVGGRMVDSWRYIVQQCDTRFHMSCFQRLEASTFFQVVTGTLILVNSLVMAVNANYQVTHVENPKTEVQRLLAWAFVIAYTVELIVRIGSEHVRFFSYGWNWFDLLIVIAGYDDVLAFDGDTESRKMSQIQVLRMLKLLVVVRLMRTVREVRLLLDSLMGSVRALMWTIILILSTIFMFGLLFVNAVASYLKDYRLENPGKDPSNRDMLMLYWGSVMKAMYTLFQSATGGVDWKEVSDSLEVVGYEYLALFLLFILFFVYAISNSVTAICIEASSQYASRDRSRLLQEQIHKKKDYMGMIVHTFDEMDADESGTLNKAEFKACMQDHSMLMFAQALEIDVMDLEQFFDILSFQGTKDVGLETFVDGCIRLRGQARPRM